MIVNTLLQECRHRIMQQKHVVQMIEDLNLIDEGLSRSLLDENGFLHCQQERMLFLGNTAATAAATVSSENGSSNGAGVGNGGLLEPNIELLALFNRSFRHLLTALQKNIDFDQILRWARSVMEMCVILVSDPLFFIEPFCSHLFGPSTALSLSLSLSLCNSCASVKVQVCAVCAQAETCLLSVSTGR